MHEELEQRVKRRVQRMGTTAFGDLKIKRKLKVPTFTPEIFPVLAITGNA